MSNRILVFLAKVLIVTLVSGCIAVAYWHFETARTAEALASLLFLSGGALIGIGVLLFAGHSNVNSAPDNVWSGNKIDPGDMGYSSNLLNKSARLLIMLVLAGGLHIVGCIILSIWF